MKNNLAYESFQGIAANLCNETSLNFASPNHGKLLARTAPFDKLFQYIILIFQSQSEYFKTLQDF